MRSWRGLRLSRLANMAAAMVRNVAKKQGAGSAAADTACSSSTSRCSSDSFTSTLATALSCLCCKLRRLALPPSGSSLGRLAAASSSDQALAALSGGRLARRRCSLAGSDLLLLPLQPVELHAGLVPAPQQGIHRPGAVHWDDAVKVVAQQLAIRFLGHLKQSQGGRGCFHAGCREASKAAALLLQRLRRRQTCMRRLHFFSCSSFPLLFSRASAFLCRQQRAGELKNTASLCILCLPRSPWAPFMLRYQARTSTTNDLIACIPLLGEDTMDDRVSGNVKMKGTSSCLRRQGGAVDAHQAQSGSAASRSASTPHSCTPHTPHTGGHCASPYIQPAQTMLTHLYLKSSIASSTTSTA